MERYKHSNILSAIGNTPIIRLNKVTRDIASEIYVKLESSNPGGSIKDRAGVYMCRKAAENNKLKPGGIIVESTSGNTGVGICLYANTHGHPCIFVMADKQSLEKIHNLKAYGAKVVICPTQVAFDDPRSFLSVAAALATNLNGLHLNQHANQYNAECHYTQTGPEIFQQTGADFDVFMAGVGTGGTISGTSKFLKEKNPALKVIGVDCHGSVLAGYHKTGEMGEAKPYRLEGIGESFLPANVDLNIIDDFEVVGDEEAFLMARAMLREEGIYAGGSSGAAVAAAITYAKKMEAKKPTSTQRILVMLPDSGNRYASKIYHNDWMDQQGYLEKKVMDTLDEKILEIIHAKGSLA